MKTILITGSTDGIGKLAAAKLAKDGHQILLHGRSSDKLNHVISEIKEQSGNEKIHGFISDLADFDTIQKLTTSISDEYSKVDVSINNVGVI